MSTAPGRIVAEIPINLTRPRETTMRGDPEFVRASMEIRTLIPR
jgi:hypothetical protein